MLLNVFVRIRVKTLFHRGKRVPDFLRLQTMEKKNIISNINIYPPVDKIFSIKIFYLLLFFFLITVRNKKKEATLFLTFISTDITTVEITILISFL